MQVQNISNSYQDTSFGTRYTKNSTKALKKYLPELANNENFEYYKKALSNLIQTKNRDDNLLINIFEEELGLSLFDFEVRHLNSKSKVFKKPILDVPDKWGIGHNTPPKSFKEIFLEDSEYINSEKFVKEANRVLMMNYTREAKLPLWKKAKESFLRTTRIKYFINDLLETIDMTLHGGGMVIVKPDGSSKTAKGISYLADNIKELINPTKTKLTPFQVTLRERKEELSKLIDKLAE